MGWAGGSTLLDEVADVVMKRIRAKSGDDRKETESLRAKVAKELVDLFEGEDCDTICECENRYIAAEYDRRYPPEES